MTIEVRPEDLLVFYVRDTDGEEHMVRLTPQLAVDLAAFCNATQEPPASVLTRAVEAYLLESARGEVPALYDVARRVSHEAGFPWTDPRTGVTYPAPPHYRCPRCGAVSFNPHDLEQRYCARCHRFETP